MLTRRPLQFLGVLLLVYLAFPVVAFLDRFATSNNRGFDVSGLWPALVVSLKTATISLAISTLFGVPLGHVLARARGRWSTIASVAVQLPLALPPIMSGILLIYLIGPYTYLGQHVSEDLTNSLIGIIIAQTFVSAPFVVIAARTAFEAVDPALDGLAATLGHRPLARFWLIDLPIALPGIRAGMVLTWLRAFGEYGAVIIVAYHPFSLPVYTETQFSSQACLLLRLPPSWRCASQPLPFSSANWAGRTAGASGLRSSGQRHRRCPRRPGWRSTWTPPSEAFIFALLIMRSVIASPSWVRPDRASRSPCGPWLGSCQAPGRCTTARRTSAPSLRRTAGSATCPRGLGSSRAGPCGGRPYSRWTPSLLGPRGGCVRCTSRISYDRLPSQLSGGQRQRVSLAQGTQPRPRSGVPGRALFRARQPSPARAGAGDAPPPAPGRALHRAGHA